jgi:hypothetical protein
MGLAEKYDEELNQLTRETFESPDVKRFYDIKLTPGTDHCATVWAICPPAAIGMGISHSPLPAYGG